MNANSLGTFFTVTTFGESRSPALGAVIDGCPSGIPLSAQDIQTELDRRKPAGFLEKKDAEILEKEKSAWLFSTKRAEKDVCEILSGVYEDKTIGTPIAVIIKNSETSFNHYENLKNIYRPGHADYAYDLRYGIRDPRGGGRASGRETAGRVIGGAVAKKMLNIFAQKNGFAPLDIKTYAQEIAGIPAETPVFEKSPLPPAVFERLRFLAQTGDSAGCVLACEVLNVPEGLGNPVFGKLDAELSKAVMSLGAVKGIAFGGGFASAALTGSQNNSITSAFSGGISGGISANSAPPETNCKKKGDAGTCPVFFTFAVKPPPSIMAEQEALTCEGEKVRLSITGNHDVCLFPRIIPAAEAMVYLVLADAVLAKTGGSLLL